MFSLGQYLQSATRKTIVTWIVLVEFLWLCIWTLAYALEGELVFDFFVFITVFNGLTLLPFLYILRTNWRHEQVIDRMIEDEHEKVNRDTWEQTVIGYYILVNLLLMVFISWVMVVVEDLV